MGRPRGRKRWTAVPRQDGRTVVVTGASSGIGLQTARILTAFGAHVVLAVRNTEKGEAVARRLPGSTEVRRLDVADLASVRAFAEETGRVDVLVNNAGIMAVPFARSTDGFESQLATNHLGHFALTNLLFLSELQRRLTAHRSTLRATGAHPGYTSTALQGGTGSWAFTRVSNLGNRLVGMPAWQGALTTVYAATMDLPGNSYVGPHGPGEMLGWPTLVGRSPAASDPAAAKALWSRSEALTGTSFPL